MAILMRYEQSEGRKGAGLAMVADEFGITPERVRAVVEHERHIATRGDGVVLRSGLPADLRARIYGR